MLTLYEVRQHAVIDAAKALVLAEGRAERRRRMTALRRAVAELHDAVRDPQSSPPDHERLG